MSIVATLKAYLRKRRISAERSKNRRMQGLKINKKMLAQMRQVYIERLDELEKKISSFVLPPSTSESKERLVGYNILSYNGDAMGKVLEKDGRIFRGVYRESAEWFDRLWKTGLIQTLAKEGLVPETTLCKYETDEFPIILEHQIVEMSSSKMWNPEMVRDACITISLIDKICRRFGYKLIDGHLNNVTFSKGKPVFTDIGSIVEDKGQYTVYGSSLIFAGGYRLIAASLGNSIIDRIQFFDEQNNAYWVYPMCYDESTIECRCLLKKFRRYHRVHSSMTANKIIFRLFELGDVEPEYFSLIFPSQKISENRSIDSDLLYDAISSLDVDSATVIGGSMLGQRISDDLGIKTTVIDHDMDNARQSYQNTDGISCYCYNYLYGGDPKTLTCLKGELVIAPNVTENVVSYQNFKLDSLFNGLSKLTDHYVAISFKVGNSHPRCQDPAKDSFEAFERKLSEFFKIISVNECNDTRIYVGAISEER